MWLVGHARGNQGRVGRPRARRVLSCRGPPHELKFGGIMRRCLIEIEAAPAAALQHRQELELSSGTATDSRDDEQGPISTQASGAIVTYVWWLHLFFF